MGQVFLKCATKIMGKIESGEIDPNDLTPATTDKDVELKDPKPDPTPNSSCPC